MSSLETVTVLFTDVVGQLRRDHFAAGVSA
jgi:hypothetical protein